MLKQFLIVALILSLRVTKHFESLTIPDFIYIASVAIPTSDVHLIVPYDMLIYSSGATLTIQKLDSSNEYDGAAQEKTHNSPITQIQAFVDGSMICILDDNNKVYCLVRKVTGDFENPVEVHSDGTNPKKAFRMRNGFIIFRDTKKIFAYSYDKTGGAFASFFISIQVESEDPTQMLDISQDGSYIGYLLQAMGLPILEQYKKNQGRKFFVFETITLQYGQGDALLYLKQESKQSVLLDREKTQIVSYGIQHNSQLVPPASKTTQQISSTSKYIMVLWQQQSAFKVLKIEQLNPSSNTLVLPDFFVNQNLTAKFIISPQSSDIIEVGHKQDPSSVDLYLHSTCHYSCSQCDTSTCTCDPAKKRQATIGDETRCSCMAKHYDDSTQECKSCHHSCAYCQGPSENQCLSCPDTDTRQYDAVANTCLCVVKYYDDSAQECKSCHHSCASCQGPSANKCLSCPDTDTRQYDAIAKTCLCIAKYYDDSTQECKSCHYSCKSCQGQSTNCTSCSEDQSFHRTLKANKCPCDIEFFDNEAQKCIACHQSCSQCISKNFCETCQLKYFDNGGHYCEPCKYSCATCVQSESNCSSCSNTRFKDQENNCICKDGFFDDGTDNQTCQSCHSSCKTCSNSTTCDTCKEGFYKYQGEEDVCFEEKFKIDVVKSEKVAAKNQVRLVFELDNPTEIAENETKVQIVSSKGQNQSLTWETSQEGASLVTLLISYNSAIQKRKVKITFYSRQETGRRVLEVLVPVFEGQVEIETYPPAQMGSQTSALSLDEIKNTVLAFSAILIILCLICLLLPRAHFYAFKYSWTIQKIFIAFGICPQIMTSWLKYCLEPLSQVSFVGGIQAYECCQTTGFLGYTANIFANSSISLFILLGLWIIYLPISFCLKNKPKVIMYYRLFILTLSLMLLPHCLFAVFNAFYDAGKNQPSAPNIVIACLLLIVFIVFVVKLVYETRKIPGPEVHHLSEITGNQETQNNNEVPNLVLFPSHYDSQSEKQDRWLEISYLSCLSSPSKLVRFNLLIIVSKIFLFCLFCAVLQGGNLALYILLIFVDPVSEICYLILRPNKHIGKFLMEIGFQLCWLTLYILMCAFASDFSKQIYSERLEAIILGFILGIVVYSIILLIGNVAIEFMQGPENMQTVKVIDSSEIKLEAGTKAQQ